MKVQNISSVNQSQNRNKNVNFRAKVIRYSLIDDFKKVYGDDLLIDLGKKIKNMPFVYQGFISKKESEKLLKLKIISSEEANELLTREVILPKEANELLAKITDRNIIVLHPDDDEKLTNKIKKIYSDIRESLGLKPDLEQELELEVALEKVKEKGQRKTITEIIQESKIYEMLDDFITKTKDITTEEIKSAQEIITKKEQEIGEARINLLV